MAISKIKEPQLLWILDAWKSISQQAVLRGWKEAGLDRAFGTDAQRKAAHVPSGILWARQGKQKNQPAVISGERGEDGSGVARPLNTTDARPSHQTITITNSTLHNSVVVVGENNAINITSPAIVEESDEEVPHWSEVELTGDDDSDQNNKEK